MISMDAHKVSRTRTTNQTKENQQGRILFVEDDAEIRTLVSTMLGYYGYEAVSASKVVDGLMLAKTTRFDLIMIDWYFSDGTGMELCKAIRSFDTKTPIYFYTGVELEPKLQQARIAGAQGFFSKPMDVDQLLQTIAKYILREETSD